MCEEIRAKKKRGVKKGENRGEYRKQSDQCLYPYCFHCILPDCEVYGVFPCESRRNAECGNLPGSGRKEREHAEDHMLPILR